MLEEDKQTFYKKAVFVDRDGTIIEQIHLLSKKEDIRLIYNADLAIKKLNESGYLVIIITNQTVVGRGIITPDELKAIHNQLLKLLKQQNAKLDGIYVCQHYPLPTKQKPINKYHTNCRCRKPSLGLIKQAVRDFNIDLSKSFLIGDSTTDILTGKNAGVPTILVKTGYAGKDGKYIAKPDFIEKNLYSAVKTIIGE